MQCCRNCFCVRAFNAWRGNGGWDSSSPVVLVLERPEYPGYFHLCEISFVFQIYWRSRPAFSDELAGLFCQLANFLNGFLNGFLKKNDSEKTFLRKTKAVKKTVKKAVKKMTSSHQQYRRTYRTHLVQRAFPLCVRHLHRGHGGCGGFELRMQSTRLLQNR